MKSATPSTSKPPEVSPKNRRECYRCFRAASVCICDQVPRICNRTGVIVIQHHREVLHPIGTARIARLGLQQYKSVVAQRHTGLVVDIDLPQGTGLLYPRNDAVDLAQPGALPFPEHLIVLDGTWTQASAIYRGNAWLHALPHYAICPAAPSRYRIRRQPRQGCLSTIEALVNAMQLIEPETEGLDQLLVVFDRMVEQQLKFQTDGHAAS